jgi:drug/metabolite transporter (DMT)-like permease
MEPTLVLLSLGSACCFALALVLTRFGLRSLTPVNGAAISVPTTALLFLALTPLTIDSDAYDAGSARLFVIAGLFFPIAVTLLTYSGNRHLGPSVTGALGNLSPLFAVGLAILLLGETPRSAQAAGMLVIVGGVVLIMLGQARGPALARGQARASLLSGAPVWAFLLPLAAALLRGVVQPVVKLGLAAWPNPFAAVTLGYAVSAVVALGAAALFGRGRGNLSRNALWFIGVGVANGLAVLTLYAALARGPVAIVAPLVASYPLATILFDRLLSRDSALGAATLAGILVTVLGVALLLAG